jgi:hypothetical protein
MSTHVSEAAGGAEQPVYEIRVKGAVGRALAGEFGPLEACTQTVLRGALPDQAALHGVLDRIRDLGLELVDVHKVGRLTPDGGGDVPAAWAHRSE